MTWLEGLNKCKGEQPNIEKLMALKSDPKLTQGIVAWKNMSVTPCESFQPEDDSFASVWKWLWECLKFDREEWRIMAGLKLQEADIVFKRLKGLKLIYPDGTVDDYTSMFIRSSVMKMLNGENKKVGRPKKAKEGEDE